jgi:hypothetical protein
MANCARRRILLYDISHSKKLVAQSRKRREQELPHGEIDGRIQFVLGQECDAAERRKAAALKLAAKRQ